MQILQAENLYFSYPQQGSASEIAILQNTNLELNSGDSVAILGASGSGKSTLLHLLAGLEQPQQGQIKLCGQDFSNASDAQKSAFRNRYMGFVYQFHHLLPEFSALENVALPLLIAKHKTKSAFQRAEKLLQRVGLGKRLQHRPAELSGGERQRAAIARALVNQPACLLADEPTGNLDQNNARLIFQLLQELIQEDESKSALLVVTHDLELAKQMKHRYQLNQGQLQII